MSSYAELRGRIPAVQDARAELDTAIRQRAPLTYLRARRSALNAAKIAAVIERVAREEPPLLAEHVEALQALLRGTQPETRP